MSDELTATELELEAVNKAILELIGGKVQSYKIGIRELTYFDLGELRRWQAQLRARIAKEKGITNSFLKTSCIRFQ